jgi:hypothetical protein
MSKSDDEKDDLPLLTLLEDDQDVLDRQASPRSSFSHPAIRRASSEGAIELPHKKHSIPFPKSQKPPTPRAPSPPLVPEESLPEQIRPISAEWITISVAGLILAVAGLVTAIITEIDLYLFGISEMNRIWQMVRWAFAGFCIFVAVPLTHGLGGRYIDSK